MEIYTSKFFGKIDLSLDENCYDAEFKYGNRVIELDLNIYPEDKPGIEQLVKIDTYLKNLEENEKELRKLIEADFKNDGMSKEYFEYHAEEFDEEELEPLIDRTNKEKTIEEQLLSKVYIQRIGFYPNDNRFAILDFYVNDEISDQILVLIVENDMNYNITWES